MKIPDLFYSECKHPKTVSVAHMRGMTLKRKKEKKKKGEVTQLTCCR